MIILEFATTKFNLVRLEEYPKGFINKVLCYQSSTEKVYYFYNGEYLDPIEALYIDKNLDFNKGFLDSI